MKYLFSVVFVIIAFTLAFSAAAKPALRDNKVVTDGLVSVGIAIEIGEKCNSISARTLRGISYLNSLKGTARKQGYTDAEIDAFVDNKAEKKRLEQQARAYLKSKGASGGVGQAYCKVGAAEIAAGTAAGRLLRQR
ncbi:DUF5333 domain-containing protein [Actibacterium sp. 188UL27-1]|uniref:DUF5333 domain-containing protein n=1 Tax=Actibacterium sp. 188UL27-1 TaxID=2786961 RepID=UPI001EF434FF|nr:DUF5333 domain-containing protein [Actibacterium sp. 188UL27-1]